MANRKPKPDNTTPVQKPNDHPEPEQQTTSRLPAGPNNRSIGDPRIDRGGI